MCRHTLGLPTNDMDAAKFSKNKQSKEIKSQNWGKEYIYFWPLEGSGTSLYKIHMVTVSKHLPHPADTEQQYHSFAVEFLAT